MSVGAKMPGSGHDCINTLSSNYSIIGLIWIVRTNIVFAPIQVIFNAGKTVVTVEENMSNIFLF